MVMLEIENNGVNNKKRLQVFVVRNITSPDIPDYIPNILKAESFGVMISDLHVGKDFMEIEFVKFLNWLSSSDQEIVNKIKFVCIGGDLIDGIGIFPNQDKELLEMDTEKQMTHVEKLSLIPKHIKVFVIPGNLLILRKKSRCRSHQFQKKISIKLILWRTLQCLETLLLLN